MQNTVKTINSYKGKINPRYELGSLDIQAIYKSSRNTYNMICDAFVLGYAQGVKATKSELKRKEQ